MDVEATLLEELETSVSDHIDLLTDQSSAWLNLQESMQQLLDIIDTLNYLPTPGENAGNFLFKVLLLFFKRSG